VKAVDALEAWMWCQDQLAMGNRNMWHPMHEIGVWLMENENVPSRVVHFVRTYEWKRYPDYLWKDKKYGNDHEQE
jgi:hypothetical protein